MLQTPTGAACPRNHSLFVGGAVAAAYWVLEALIDSVLINHVPIATRLFPADLNELWMRSLTCALFIAFGAYSDIYQARVRSAQAARAESARQLQEILAKLISGFIPICAWCKQIHTPDGYWQTPESYISAHSDACFTHTICPACERQHFAGDAQTSDPVRSHSF